MKTILVTGSSGFVGKPLVKRLKQLGYKIVRFDLSEGKDILDKKSFKNLPKIDIVFHLAAIVGYLNVVKNPLQAYKVNVIGTLDVLKFCQKQKAKMIFPSSYVYGPPYDKAKKETDPLKPANLYTYSKYLGELFCQFYAARFKTQAIILRISNAYGPNQPKQYIIPLLLEKLQKEKIVTLNDPETERDFIYIDDLIRAYIKIAQTPTKPGEVFNISSGKAISLKKLAQFIKKLTNSKTKIKFVKKLRADEVLQNLMDNTKFCKKTRWKPQIKLKKGLTKIIKDPEINSG